jgi:NADH dehydrogenase
VANIFGWHLSGFVAWLVWLLVHLMHIVQFRSRLTVFIEWAIEYLTFHRGARLITGPTATDSCMAGSSAGSSGAGSGALIDPGNVAEMRRLS